MVRILSFLTPFHKLTPFICNQGKLHLTYIVNQPRTMVIGLFLFHMESGTRIGRPGVVTVQTDEVIIKSRMVDTLLDIDGERFPNMDVRISKLIRRGCIIG